MVIRSTHCRSVSAAAAGAMLLAGVPATVALGAEAIDVHVNQVGLELDGPKSAVVDYAGHAPSGRFFVYQGQDRVYEGDLRPVSGFDAWGGGRSHFVADFSALHLTGQFRVRAAIEDAEGDSAPFAIGEHELYTAAAGALVDYFRLSRHVRAQDHHIRVFGTDKFVDVWGGWKDAGGDYGKYLSHLSYANYFNPQQTGFAAWALAHAYEMAPRDFRRAGIERATIDEALWGADFLHRLLSREGYFYMTVFDRWAAPGAERVLTAYSGEEGTYSTHYQAAFREGGGVSIAALAAAARLSRASGLAGAYTADEYQADAERAFAHLQQHNREYDDDGHENIIDDYTALLAAVELSRTTGKGVYLEAARARASSLASRLTDGGWWRSDDDTRPFYHGADAGFPVLALSEYLRVEADPVRQSAARDAIRRALAAQLALDDEVANPYDYPRQQFRLYREGHLEAQLRSGFFMPHANETGYWWQGESARLASLAVAAIVGGRAAGSDTAAAPTAGNFGVSPALAAFAQHQVDWTLGRNPFDVCLLQGFGVRNPPHNWSAGDAVRGGISNGITGAAGQDDGSGIQFGSPRDADNWRWYEQWIPHVAWFLLATTAMASGP